MGAERSSPGSDLGRGAGRPADGWTLRRSWPGSRGRDRDGL